MLNSDNEFYKFKETTNDLDSRHVKFIYYPDSQSSYDHISKIAGKIPMIHLDAESLLNPLKTLHDWLAHRC